MICSMTGFGQAEAQKRGERFIVTLKSVNHRYFETSFHLPPSLDHLEGIFRSKIQGKISRGRVNISINHVNESSEGIVLNQELAQKYHHALDGLRKKLNLSQGLEVATLVSLPGVVAFKKEELRSNERESLIRAALVQALRRLVDMRHKEGAALAKDLARCVRRIGKHMTTVKKLIAQVLETSKKTMTPEELESFLRSTDVAEEVTRIDFHLKNFLRHMKGREPKGKILDFIGQELQREINTLGAKVQEKHVAYQVVMVKDQIEKIREQVQNVE